MPMHMTALHENAPLLASAPADAPLFALEDVSFAIPGRVLLQPLTLSLAPGRVIGLVGHNGSGKSTLVKILARQQAPTSGSVRFGGTLLGDWGERAFARQVAYLPQHIPPATSLLSKELVALGRYPWHGPFGRFSKTDSEKVAEAMALADVGPFADRLVDTLSGGERQRVWLSMLMAQDTRCLLLDEPISALDIAHQVDVLALVQRLSRERGIGVIVVLHDVNMAARYCDELVALHGGRLIARGTPAEIMTPACLKSIYGIEMGVMPHPQSGGPVSFVL